MTYCNSHSACMQFIKAVTGCNFWCNYGWTEKEKNAICKTLNFINRNSKEKDLTVLNDIQWHVISEKCGAETPLITWDGDETKQNLDLRDCRLLSTLITGCENPWHALFTFLPPPTASALPTEMLYYQFNADFRWRRILYLVSLLRPYWLTFSRSKVCFRDLNPPFSSLQFVCIHAELECVFAPFASTMFMLTPGMFSLMSNIFLSVPAFLP